MRGGWQIKKLGEITDLFTGGTPTSNKTEYYKNGKIKWLVSGDVHKKEIFDCEGRITKEGMNNSNAKILPINSVIIALNGQGKTRGTVALLRTEATCNQSIISIAPKNPNEVLPEYIYCNLAGRYEELRKLTGDSGNDRRGLNMPIIRNIEIPLAPIDEQRRIVAFLAEAFTAIDTAKENAEKNLKNAHELFEAYSKDTFSKLNISGKEKILGEVVTFFNGFAFKSKDEVRDSNTQVVRISNLYKNRLDLKRRPAFYPNKFITTYQRYLLKENDLIISLTGTAGKEDFGYTVKIQATDLNLLMNQRIAKIVINDESKLNRTFLLHFLLSRTFLDQLFRIANGTRQANLSTDNMRDIPIVIPDINEQRTISDNLDALSNELVNLEAIYIKKIGCLEELRKSILNKAFNGDFK